MIGHKLNQNNDFFVIKLMVFKKITIYKNVKLSFR